MFEDNEMSTLDEETPPEETGNRTFLIVAGVLGGIILLSIACVAGYAFIVLPRQASANATQQALRIAQNVQAGQTLTAIWQSEQLSQTPASTSTPTVTNTPVFQNETPTLGVADPQTATVIAALTQAAQAQLTITALPTSTKLPATGFADEVGAPGLIVMAIALVAVILLARRLRTSPAK